MDAVFALADRITVLVYGRIIASGAPATIRANEEVRQAYLGESGAGPWLSGCSSSTVSRPGMGAARCCSASRSPSRAARW